MYSYNIVEGVVIERTFRKKKGDIEHIIREHIPTAKIFKIDGSGGNIPLYKRCCMFTEISEDIVHYDWFVSDDKLTAQAIALLSVIESNHEWNVLQDNQTFDKWVEGRVR